jgi:hypothetical protein
VQNAGAGIPLGFDHGIQVVDDIHAIDGEVIFMHASRGGADGDGPPAIVCFFHQGFLAELSGHLDFARLGSPAAESDAAIREDQRRGGRVTHHGAGGRRRLRQSGQGKDSEEQGKEQGIHEGAVEWKIPWCKTMADPDGSPLR